MESVLDLPLTEQEQIAKAMGLTHANWLESVKRRASEADEFLNEITTGETDMTQEQIAHMQRKMDEPLTPR